MKSQSLHSDTEALPASKLKFERANSPIPNSSISLSSSRETNVQRSDVNLGRVDAENTTTDIQSSLQHGNIELAWYQFARTVQRVAAQRRVSGREFNILNFWGFLFLILINGVLFVSLAAVSIRYTELFIPVSEKRTVISCIVIAWLLIVIELLVTSGYLLTKLHCPLVRSRGKQYIFVTAFGVFGNITPLCIIALARMGVIKTSMPVLTTLLALSTASSILFLGAQLCRQRLIYLLFEVKMVESHRIYTYSYIYVVVWALLVGSATMVLGNIHEGKFKHLMAIPVHIGYYAVLFVTGYYTYKSRHVMVGFSDWRSNALILLFYTMTSTVVFAMRIAYLSGITRPTPANAPTIISVTLITFCGVCFCMSLCTVFLFGQITIITFLKLDVVGDLDPRTTFQNRRQNKTSASSVSGETRTGLFVNYDQFADRSAISSPIRCQKQSEKSSVP